MKYKITHIYADADGETHFGDKEISYKAADYAPPAPPIDTSTHETATGFVSIAFQPGWFGDFHPAPKRQWMIIVAGTLEIGVSDGEKRTLSAGTVALVEEPGSKGHSTRVVGDEPSYLMVCELD